MYKVKGIAIELYALLFARLYILKYDNRFNNPLGYIFFVYTFGDIWSILYWLDNYCSNYKFKEGKIDENSQVSSDHDG